MSSSTFPCRSFVTSSTAIACLLAGVACGSPEGHPQPAPTPGPMDAVPAESQGALRGPRGAVVPAIRVIVTVDWEGRDLTGENLAAMETVRARHPEVPLTHFLNAAYFTKPDADAADVEASMRRPLRRGDELGLHVHGWRRLFEAAGVTFRSSPSFWGSRTPLEGDCAYDCGHEVAISGYAAAELESVIRFSVRTLSSHGFGRATAFRTGGWVATPRVRQALFDQGILFDHSAVPAPFLADELEGLPLLAMVEDLWSSTTPGSQPYAIAAGRGTITEIPDNGALADYVSPADMISVVDAATAEARKAPGSEPVVSIGFHQETAANYAHRVDAVLSELDRRVAEGRLVVRYGDSRFVAAPPAARRAR